MSSDNKISPETVKNKEVINPAEDPAYKPVRQVFGSIWCGLVMIVEVLFLILILVALYYTVYSKLLVFNFLKEVRNFMSVKELKNNPLFEFLNAIVHAKSLSVINGVLKLEFFFALSLTIEIVFYGMILYNPAYCGGNPSFIKTWPIILSGVFGALSGYFLRLSIPICLILFGMKYFMYFRNDNSRFCCCCCCCGCGCFKPWVYKKIIDDEAPEDFQ